jgi:hypothetical protein
MDLNSKYEAIVNMADYGGMWPVFIPLIVGLAPGLVYWFAITARRTGK